jgi:hypothetical protein
MRHSEVTMRSATALLSMGFMVMWGGCFLAHDRDAEAARAEPDPEPMTDPAPAPRVPEPDPGHDICPETPGPGEACECGIAERFPHPDESGRCFVCRECAVECEIPNPEDGPIFSGARLTWQAPGGFAGHGPAVIVDDGGLVRVWDETPEFAPASTPATPPDREIDLGFPRTDQLFLRILAAETAALPHDGPWNECYPQFHFIECEGCDPIQIDYSTPSQIRPELDCVIEWFGRLPGVDPGAWCDF